MIDARTYRRSLIASCVWMAGAQMAHADASDQGTNAVAPSAPETLDDWPLEPTLDWHGWTSSECDAVVELRAYQATEQDQHDAVRVFQGRATRPIFEVAGPIWGRGYWARGFRPIIDNAAVVKALTLSTTESAQGDEPSVIFEWLPGDPPVHPDFPRGTGVELGWASGSFKLQMRYENSGSEATDRSGVAVCLVRGRDLRRATTVTLDAPSLRGEYVDSVTCTLESNLPTELLSFTPAMPETPGAARLLASSASAPKYGYETSFKASSRGAITPSVPITLRRGDAISLDCSQPNGPQDRSLRCTARVNVAAADVPRFSCY